jgi:hypothetical protein
MAMKLLQRATLILLAVLLLAGCGTLGRPDETGSTNIPFGPTATPTLPTALHVIRPAVNGYPSLDRTIHDTKAVQRLYRAAYALPFPPPGKVNCPADIAMIYDLIFLQGTTPLQQMTLQATGCQFLRLSPQADRVRLTTEAFRSLFLKTVGIPSLVPGVP